MRRVQFDRFGPPSVLRVAEGPDREPGPGEVRVRVAAAGVNFADLMARMGLYDKTPPLPAVVGWEVAGEVDRVGNGVDPARLGEPVVAVCHFGGYADQVVVPAEQALRRPDGMDAVTGAAFPVHALSCWMMLDVLGRVRQGDRVLVHSAGGGIGSMAIGLLRSRGAYAVGTASRRKHEGLRAAGWDQLVDPREEDLQQALAGQPRFDLILDPIGGRSWAVSLDLLRGGGKLVVYGYSTAVAGPRRRLRALAEMAAGIPWTRFSPFALMRHNQGVLGMELEHLWAEKDRVRGWMLTVLDLWRQGVLVPKVHAAVPLAEAARAHQMLHDRENVGKVVLVTDG
jgi:NADPH:quinone reductase-like Zn-dependent oxidoreductase